MPEYARDGKHYPDRLGKSGFIDLLDVSSVQGKIDWAKVAKSGVRGVYVKSSQYSSTRDSWFARNSSGAAAAGLAVGAYHFAFVGSGPVKQAQFFWDACEGTGGKGQLPPVLDIEFVRPGTVGPKETVKWAEAFMAELTRLAYPGQCRKPIWYTYPHFAASLQPYLSTSTLTGYGLWLARYKDDKAGKLIGWYPEDGSKPDMVPPACNPVLWQYSGNKGYRVPGVPWDVDRNVFLGSSDEFDVFLGKAPGEVFNPTPPPPPLDLTTVRGYQEALRDLGYDPGPLDGKHGPRTDGAVRGFQGQEKLSIDGVVGPKTRAALQRRLQA